MIKANQLALKYIAVIGAGMAGLACATELQKVGLQVTVFEKSRGASGRLSTRLGLDNNQAWQCDHGAQYFTARDATFRAEVLRWQQAGVAEIWQPRLQETDGLDFWEKEKTVERFVGVPRNNAPAQFLSASVTLNTNMTIIEMQKTSAGWQLNSKEQGWLNSNFDAVVLAIPAPQAVPLLQGLSTPLALLASSVKMRGCWAVMLRFNKPLTLKFDGLFVNKPPLSWVARDSSKPGRADLSGLETWVLHADAVWSEAHIEDSPERVAEYLIDAFLALGGRVPDAYTVHRWRYADCENVASLGSAWDKQAQIGLCGDWLNVGKVQGAWLSGYQLAQKLLAINV